MKSTLSFFAGIALATLLLAPATSRGQEQHEDIVTIQQKQSSKSFTQYALGKINPDGKNYGDSLRRVHREFINSTLDDLYFWSNVVTLVLLTGVTMFLVFHIRAGEKKEIIAASLIAQLWNGRVSDRIEIERRTAQYNELVERHNAEIERSLMTQAKDLPKKGDARDLERSIDEVTEKPISAKAEEKSQLDTPGPISIPQTTKAADVSNLQQQNLLLRQQVEAIRNTEQNLKARLNQTIALLEKERMRNQTLKGV
jgi:hypothetical protein